MKIETLEKAKELQRAIENTEINISNISKAASLTFSPATSQAILLTLDEGALFNRFKKETLAHYQAILEQKQKELAEL